MAFDVKEYWNNRLNSEFSLKGVGYISFSKFYNKWLYKTKTFILSKIIRENKLNLSGSSVLDIGSGTGFFVNYYTQNKAKITGLDITDISVQTLSKEYPAGKFYCMDISREALNEKFDIINMWDVMYHQVDDDLFKSALSNIAKMSKPGTAFIITDSFGRDAATKVSEHVVFRSFSDYETIMADLGFKLIKIYPLYRWMNRHYSWGIKITNALSPLLYFLDKNNKKIAKYNLSVAVWVYQK